MQRSPSQLRRRSSPSRRSLLLLLLVAAIAVAVGTAKSSETMPKTHYDILEVQRDATLKDIKKAYRRLAVQHHPDRNIGDEERATIRFREVNEAYQILSDESARREYDMSLRMGGTHRGSSSGTYGGTSGGGGGGNSHRHRTHRDPFRDPFDQFNDVFRNDPFFADAFRSMDDLFNSRFDGQQRHRGSGGGTTVNNQASASDGGIWGMFHNYLPNIQVTTSSTTSYGGQSRSTSRSYSTMSTTSRSTSTIIQNGQRITVQSLEKDGNRIEEKYVGNTLIERTVNGRKEEIGRIKARGEQEF